jgi:hypothetical protein
MSIFKTLFSGLIHVGTEVQAAPSSNGIQRATVTGMTRPDAITPHNLTFGSVQTAATVPTPRYATQAEAWATQQLRDGTVQALQAANTMYRNLEVVDTADTALHSRHNRYQAKLMANEGKRQRSNAKLASTGQQQRVAQATVAGAYDLSVNRANRNIEAIGQAVADMGVSF